MEFLRKLEAYLEKLLRSLAGPGGQRSIQPVEIGRQLAKAMLADRRVSTVHVYVPNQFSVLVSSDDWQKLEPLSATIIADMCEYLENRARRSGVSFVAPVHIEFRSEDSLSTGSVQVQATFQEIEGGMQTTALRKDGDEAAFSNSSVGDGNGTQAYELPTRVVSGDGRAGLTAMNGPQQGQEWVLGSETVTIGRSPDQHIHLRDASVSRCHAVIRLSQNRYWIEDNGSTNGTRVNQELIQKAILDDGDIIQVGTLRLRFRVVR